VFGQVALMLALMLLQIFFGEERAFALTVVRRTRMQVALVLV
jgi:hypothetical protein